MRRSALERPRTLRTWRAHLTAHEDTILCVCELEPGRFRKSQRIGGCGRPRCWLCHGDKLAGRLSLQELRALAAHREGLAHADSRRLG